MTIFLDEFTALPAPSDVELEAMDRRNRDNGDLMTLAQYCDAVAIHGPTRTRLIQYVGREMDRMEARGHDVPEPWRRTRWDWYRDYNAVLALDERETEMGARYAGSSR